MVLVLLLSGLASVWTDVLWFSQLGFADVYRTQVVTETGLFLAGGLVMGGAVFASIAVAYRSRPIYAPVGVDAATLERYRESIEPLRRLVMVALPLALGLFAGSSAGGQWQTLLLWWNSQPFGSTDAQFHLDLGFYVFTLPWLEFVVAFFSAVVFLAGLAGLATHYLYGGLRLASGGPRLTSVARVHLTALAAAFLLLRAADAWLGRYSLTTSQSKNITGLTYTDANASVTAKGIVAAVAVVVAVLFIVAAVVERWRLLPMYGLALLLITAIVVGGVYPAVVQQFQVTPNSAQLESPYVQKNIDATRAAYGLDKVQVQKYAAKSNATQAALKADAALIPGIRLLDPSIVSDTYKNIEQIKPYYTFASHLDVDRYVLKGESSDAVVAARELNLDGIPAGQHNWVNDHLYYTHGFGLVGAYGNKKAPDGSPEYFMQRIPTQGALTDYEPRIYFGEQTDTYSIVGGLKGGQARELDYPDDTATNGQRNTTYSGTGGVPIGSFWNRLLYTVTLREQNLLLSDGINAESRILYDRTPRERVAKVAPYLTLDQDVYPSVVGGRIVWIVDGYTTSDRYPYSTLRLIDEATADTQTPGGAVPLDQQQVNYMRNSVKATVDAYDGTVTLYAWDEADPVLKAWRTVFPTDVKPLTDISGDLMSHLRYPEDLFKMQRSLLQRYHVTTGPEFFGGNDIWAVPADPTAASTATATFQPPYYLSIQMPGADKPHWSLTTTFQPRNATVLSGFLAVDADAGSTPGKRRDGYGTLRLLELPPQSVPGPGQVQNQFTSDPVVRNQMLALSGSASTVTNGNLLTLPLAGGLMYVQPVYVRSKGATSLPLLQKVLVEYGGKIGFEDTLQKALDSVFGGGASTVVTPPPTGVSPTPGATPSSTSSPTAATGTSAERLKAALADANAALAASDSALKAGDWTAYGQAQTRLKDAITRAVAAQGQLTGSGSVTSAGPVPPSPTASQASPSPTG